MVDAEKRSARNAAVKFDARLGRTSRTMSLSEHATPLYLSRRPAFERFAPPMGTQIVSVESEIYKAPTATKVAVNLLCVYIILRVSSMFGEDRVVD